MTRATLLLGAVSAVILACQGSDDANSRRGRVFLIGIDGAEDFSLSELGWEFGFELDESGEMVASISTPPFWPISYA